MKNSVTENNRASSRSDARQSAQEQWVWLNGQVLPLAEARIDVEDRGFQFADGVYEVIRVYRGQPFTMQEHLERLQRSCQGIGIELSIGLAELADQIRALLARTAIAEAWIYLQVTRGVAPRNHLFPAAPKPTILFYVRPMPPTAATDVGQKLITLPDDRWRRCWIKSIALLPNVLAKNQAASAGADEALFVEEGQVSECSASNFFAVIDGQIITAPVGPKVLPGITRQVLLQIAPDAGFKIIERAPRVEEVRAAAELFITSTTREINWVSSLDGQSFPQGPITKKLHQVLRAYIQKR